MNVCMDRLGTSDGALTRGHEKLEMLSFVEKTARRVDAFPTLMFVRVRGRVSALSLGGNPAKFIKRRELKG